MTGPQVTNLSTRRSNRRKNVSIKAQVVEVNQANGTTSKRSNRRTRKTRKLPDGTPDLGVEAPTSGLSVSTPKGMNKLITELKTKGHELSEHAEAWCLRYLDPCGEHKFSLDYGKVPDGALLTSANPQFRFLETIELPFQSTGGVVLDGDTYSALFMLMPLIRQMGILIVNADDREFDSTLMTTFCQRYAQTDFEHCVYPIFAPIHLTTDTDGPRTWYTVFDTQALRAIDPPNALGVSSTIESTRVTSYGCRITYNTPDLINQGTFAASRYPVNQITKAIDTPTLQGFTPFALTTFLFANAVQATITSSANVGFPGGNVIIPSPTGTFTENIRNADATFVASAGDNFQFVAIGTDLVLVSGASSINVGIVQTQVVNRFYFQVIDIDEPEVVEDEIDTITLITIPPVTQADILQANPRGTSGLLKEWGGVYIPGTIFEPVFRVQSSLAYSKLAFATPDSVIDDVFNHIGGMRDTTDLNFGSMVINMKSVPYAAKMQVKIERTDEIVPANDSLAAAFATGCPCKEELAISVAMGLADKEPHGYPADYNSFGILFKKMAAALRLLPRIIGTAQNVAACINAVSDEMSSVSSNSGYKRLQRL